MESTGARGGAFDWWVADCGDPALIGAHLGREQA